MTNESEKTTAFLVTIKEIVLCTYRVKAHNVDEAREQVAAGCGEFVETSLDFVEYANAESDWQVKPDGAENNLQQTILLE